MFRERSDFHVTSLNTLLFGVFACLLLAGAVVFGRQHTGELSGIHGIPVQGHDIVAAVKITGTKHIQFPRIRERLQSNGADLRLGWPLESQTLCRFKEVLLDVMREKGYLDAEIAHDASPTFGNPRHLTLKFTITEGKRSRREARVAPMPSPAERCLR